MHGALDGRVRRLHIHHVQQNVTMDGHMGTEWCVPYFHGAQYKGIANIIVQLIRRSASGLIAVSQLWSRIGRLRRPVIPTREQNQYQSTMDFLRSMSHCFDMEPLKDGNGNERPLLSVVDDDESMRESLPDLIKEFGFAARAFASAEEFLSSDSIDETSCLILDIVMPGMSGPELHQELNRRGEEVPVIFITGQRNETIRARVLEQGAAGFLLKPFSDADLLAVIKTAMQGI